MSRRPVAPRQLFFAATGHARDFDIDIPQKVLSAFPAPNNPQDRAKELGESQLIGISPCEAITLCHLTIICSRGGRARCPSCQHFHTNMGEKGRAEMGVTEGLSQINVGLEGFQELVEDMDQALKKAGLEFPTQSEVDLVIGSGIGHFSFEEERGSQALLTHITIFKCEIVEPGDPNEEIQASG